MWVVVFVQDCAARILNCCLFIVVACSTGGCCEMWNSALIDLDAFYPVRPECQAEALKTRFKARTGKTLSVRRWQTAISVDGHLDIAGVLRRIQRGGIHPSIKGEVWEFLLGCFDPNSTFAERDEVRKRRRAKYAAWKAECQKMVPVIGSGKMITDQIITDDGQPINNPFVDDGQPINNPFVDNGQPIDNPFADDGVLVTNNGSPADKKVNQWKLLLHQIGLDVHRTDRALVFYENEANQAKLWDVLSVYAWVDGDIGYVQGMSDICSPMIILLENEADAFWCFEHAMRRLRENFRCSASSMGVQSQLAILSQIIKTIDPMLHQHLEELDGGEYLFAFRMLMVVFRREFSFVDALCLWEVMWAMEYDPNLYTLYEGSHDSDTPAQRRGEMKLTSKMLKQYGKFERKNVQTGSTDQKGALAVFLAAGVLEAKNKKLVKEAKGLDDVVNILGEITGTLDAKKALKSALKVQKKYLSKAKKS